MEAKGKLRSSTRLVEPLFALAGLAAAIGLIADPAAAADTAAVAGAPYHGPRKTIAISGFDAAGPFLARYGDAGTSLSAMLATELARTDRFVLVERPDVDTLLRERALAQSGTTNGAVDGQLTGAQIFVRGTVTEFEEQERGGGFNIGFNGGGLLGSLGQQRSSGRMAITLRLIDASTGAVLATHVVERRFSNSSVNLTGQVRGLSVGGGNFSQAAIGRVAREAIAEATRTLVAAMERVPWQALVAEVDADRVYISAGRNANLAPGARLRAVRQQRTITDPATGQVLGSEQRTIADLVIESVHDRYAIGRLASPATLQRGDVVHLIGG